MKTLSFRICMNLTHIELKYTIILSIWTTEVIEKECISINTLKALNPILLNVSAFKDTNILSL